MLLRVGARGRPLVHFFRMILMPFLGAFLGSYGARTAFEINSIYAYNSVPTAIAARVNSMSSRYGFSATVQSHDNAREVSVEIDGALYSRLEPYRHPGRDCIYLPVQIGRDGVKRYILPAKLFDEPISAGHYSLCPTTS
jgi:hypothetical protein